MWYTCMYERTYTHNVLLNVHTLFCRSMNVSWQSRSFQDWHQEGCVMHILEGNTHIDISL